MENRNQEEATTGQRSTAAQVYLIVILLAIIGAIVFCIIKLDARNAAALQKESELEAQLEEEKDERAELQESADELCSTRIVRYTSKGILELDQFLYSYEMTATETGWIGEDSKIVFDFSERDTSGHVIAVYTKDGDEKTYKRELKAKEGVIDNHTCKLGAQSFDVSRDDLFAIGRVLVGDTSEFYTE